MKSPIDNVRPSRAAFYPKLEHLRSFEGPRARLLPYVGKRGVAFQTVGKTLEPDLESWIMPARAGRFLHLKIQHRVEPCGFGTFSSFPRTAARRAMPIQWARPSLQRLFPTSAMCLPRYGTAGPPNHRPRAIGRGDCTKSGSIPTWELSSQVGEFRPGEIHPIRRGIRQPLPPDPASRGLLNKAARHGRAGQSSATLPHAARIRKS